MQQTHLHTLRLRGAPSPLPYGNAMERKTQTTTTQQWCRCLVKVVYFGWSVCNCAVTAARCVWRRSGEFSVTHHVEQRLSLYPPAHASPSKCQKFSAARKRRRQQELVRRSSIGYLIARTVPQFQRKEHGHHDPLATSSVPMQEC